MCRLSHTKRKITHTYISFLWLDHRYQVIKAPSFEEQYEDDGDKINYRFYISANYTTNMQYHQILHDEERAIA